MTGPACNIDARGKALRLVGGFITLGVAAVLTVVVLLGWLGPGWWIAVGGAVAGGAFQLYEGWSGWCALRAMGIKTPF